MFVSVCLHLHPTSKRTATRSASQNATPRRAIHNAAARKMAPRSAIANISFTVDSASEDDMTHDELNALPTPDSNTENKAPARKARTNTAHTKSVPLTSKTATKGKQATRRESGSTVVGAKKASATVAKKASAKGGRKALAERKDINGSDTEEVDDFEEEGLPPPQAVPNKRGRPAKKVHQEDVAQVPTPPKKGRKAAAKAPAAKAALKPRTAKRLVQTDVESEPVTIPETQQELEADPMDVEDSIEIDEIPESMPPPPQPRPTSRRVQAVPGRPRQASAGIRRTGSISDSERDPALRRKVGDLTRKLEAMTVKYDTLKEAALSGKESNFDQLRRRTEQTTKGTICCHYTLDLLLIEDADQDAVIKAMKQQISESQSRASDLTSTKKELAQLAKENARLHADHKKLTESLTSAQNESKMLSNKLAAARSSTQPESKTVPGSAVKARATGVVLPGTAEAAKEAQLAKQKVDMYSDLTNLVVLGVKRTEDEEDVYDCLQTGRNGSKLNHPVPYLHAPSRHLC